MVGAECWKMRRVLSKMAEGLRELWSTLSRLDLVG